MDEPSVKWNKARWDEIVEGVTPFLEATGFKQDQVHWVPISGITGDNMKDRVDNKTCSWYNGPSLVELINTLPLEPRFPNGPLRVPILDKLVEDGGRTIFGKVESGTLRLGDKCCLSPSELPCQVGLLKDSKGNEVEYARPGENIQAKLLRIDTEDKIDKGNVLCLREAPVPVTELMEAEIELLELLSYKQIMSRGYACILHMHTLAVEVNIKDIVKAIEVDGSGQKVEKERPKYIRSHAKATVRIGFNLPVPVEKYADCAPLGRFTLRDEGKTIATGRVIKYKPVQGAATRVAELQKKLEQQKINEVNKGKAEDLVFNMETGQTEKAKKAPETIEEGKEEESD